jgi:hypothetical protein
MLLLAALLENIFLISFIYCWPPVFLRLWLYHLNICLYNYCLLFCVCLTSLCLPFMSINVISFRAYPDNPR